MERGGFQPLFQSLQGETFAVETKTSPSPTLISPAKLGCLTRCSHDRFTLERVLSGHSGNCSFWHSGVGFAFQPRRLLLVVAWDLWNAHCHFVIRLLSALASQLWVARRKLGNSPHQCYIEQDFFGYVFKYLYSKYKKPISRPCFNCNPWSKQCSAQEKSHWRSTCVFAVV